MFEAKRKASKVNRSCQGGDLRDQGMERIRKKLIQMREDLGGKLEKGDQDPTESDQKRSQETDPPDKGGGSYPLQGKAYDQRRGGNHCKSVLNKGLSSDIGNPGCIKDLIGERLHTQKPYHTTSNKNRPSMAEQDPRKCKAPMSQGEEVASNGKAGLGTRPTARGGSSRGREDMYHPLAGHGAAANQGERYGDIRDAVAPVFPVNMEVQATNVVAMDLSKLRAAMRSRWIVISLFFSVQLFSIGGLFQELKHKWGG